MYQDLVDRFIPGRFTKLKWARFKALLNCLSSKDACLCTIEMLATPHDSYMREAMCHKLKADIGCDGWQDCHTALSRQLIRTFDNLETQQRRQHGYVLGVLAGLEAAPQFLKHDILPRLLASETVSIRKYAYAALEEIDATVFIADIETVWEMYPDKFCASLIVKKLSIDFQDKHFDDLLAVADHWTTTALFLNVPLTPERLAQLKESDGVTYAYICTKRDIILSDDEAAELWEQHKKDERAGLLMWCFGQMKLQDFIENVQLNWMPKPDTIQQPSEKYHKLPDLVI